MGWRFGILPEISMIKPRILRYGRKRDPKVRDALRRMTQAMAKGIGSR